ncbi:MAG TPA: hypothetical protein VIL74_05920 [Pyrinomonadaceae bacterium]|jgi:hypothetical protein
MSVKFLLSLILVCSISFAAQVRPVRRTVQIRENAPSAQNDSAQKLPIRRVILYSNGVAYIERRGIVSGNADIDLSFKQSQVDDVLKSMVVLDLGQGKIGAVSYNSSAPVGSRMAEIPFSVNPLTGEGGGIAGVLAQLQGARVAVASAKGAATGAILTVERKQIRTEKETTATSVLVIASESGEISSFDLSEVKSVRLLDAGTQKDLNEFAAATASARRRDAKTITITSNGAGQREMIVSYTIAAPIWKTTYRVVLDEAGKPFFQGWAIVDNVSEEDWQNVQLSLVSGSPISFIQQLQKPFYRYRPVVPTPRDLQLNPQIYEPQSGATIDTTDNKIGTTVTNQTIESLPKGTSFNSLLKTSPSVRPEALAGGFTADGSSGAENVVTVDGQELTNYRTGQLSQTKVGDALLNSANSYGNSTTGDEIGDLFEYRIEQPVTVLRDRSALIPIIQTKMDGERVAVYNEAARRDRPFSGVLLKNTTDLTLESGSLTVIDNNAYAGEALMERLNSKEERLVSFALDLGTRVEVSKDLSREPVRLVKFVNGNLQLQYFQTAETLYEISNQTARPKVVYLEYPIQEGWELTENSPKPDYKTQSFYRFRVELSGMENKKVKILLRRPTADNYQLTSFSRNDLQLFVAQRYIDEATRVKLDKIIDLRLKIAEIQNRFASFNEEVDKIAADQKRLRENIEALSKTAEAKTLIARYIAKANEQETRLEEMEKERRTLGAELTRLNAELAGEIRAFTIEQ